MEHFVAIKIDYSGVSYYKMNENKHQPTDKEYISIYIMNYNLSLKLSTHQKEMLATVINSIFVA